ncbi:MAG: tripartite tricarboxylate transporter TctB family protein [Atribacterota bacterium]|jgi:hypothetical protein|nr:tripartite tricarboxylate transporter TctB family protein [Atribacterota bacterium]MDD4896415.1 tripartite tricarboxylate transporter TctB family protein [Atribacterota bacterium]MDD5637753.1 tripartite tricarboxylate transporter TctB family protein [Atribacterota bacterium]
MGKKEIILSMIFIIVSIIVFALTFQFPHQTVALAPTAFPRFISASLILLSIILLIQGIKGITKGASGQSGQKEEKLKKYKGFIFKLILMMFLAFLYTRIIGKIGYLASTPPFIAGNMLLFKERRVTWIIALSLTITFLLYFIFRMVFKIPIPRFTLF